MKDSVIKKIVQQSFKPILNQNFRLYKNIIYQYPLNNILLGFCFDKSGFNKDCVYISVFAQPLYINADNIILSFGNRLKGKDGNLWQLENNPNLEEILSELLLLMKDVIDDFLNKVNTPSRFYNYYQDKLVNIRMVEAVTYSAIYSKHKDSELILENYIKILQNENLEIDWVKNLLDVAKNLKLIIDDDEAIQNLFKKNIDETKQALGL